MKTISSLLASACALATMAIAQPKTHYDVKDLGTLPGGMYSYAYGINERGVVSGGSATDTLNDPLGIAQTAVVWDGRYGEHKLNLGTLGGAACPLCNSVAAATSANGLVAVISETSKMDPLGEDFCGFGTFRQCRAAIWKDGLLAKLPRLPGGFNSQVYWINNGGEAVGFSEDGVLDPTCVPGLSRRYEAVKWVHGQIEKLQPLPGDAVSFAFYINEQGEAVGVSGMCGNTHIPPAGAPSGPHAVIWDKHGLPRDLGSMAGASAYAATAMNDRGEVVGNAVFPDGSVHPFLWTKHSGMVDLGVATGDFATIIPCCGTINNRGEIVAFSCGEMGCRGVIRQNDEWKDLTALVEPGTFQQLVNVASINDAGQIVGYGITNDAGEIHAFIATPSKRD